MISYLDRKVKDYAARDKEKREACKRESICLLTIDQLTFLDILLIEVPYWWDNKKESLMATIQLYRPDLIKATDSLPIPAQPPMTFTINAPT